MTPNVHARTDVGRQRDTNEDAVLAEAVGDGHLLVVADGMGGHAAGDVASDCATTEIGDAVSTALSAGRTDHEAILREAIADANAAVHDRAADPGRRGMGTTAVAAIVVDGEAVIANVGDSRAYLVAEGIEQLTVDQSLVRELVEQGQLTEAEAATHPQRNVVSQALGTTEDVEPDLYRRSVEGTLLLCSDGLTEEVAEATIADTVADAPDLAAAADRLVETANRNGGSDNVSVVLWED